MSLKKHLIEIFKIIFGIKGNFNEPQKGMKSALTKYILIFIFTFFILFLIFDSVKEKTQTAIMFLGWDGFSAIGTVLAAGATFYTILQINSQRKDNFKPKVVMVAGDVLITFDETYNPLDINGFKMCASSSLFFDLINVGTGIAENVKCTAILDIENFITLLEELDSKNLFEIQKFQTSYKIFCNSETFDCSLERTFNYTAENHILLHLSSGKSDRILISLESNYLQYLLLVNYLTSTLFYNYNEIDKIPRLKYLVEYNDIEGNFFKNIFEVRISKSFVFYNIHIRDISK